MVAVIAAVLLVLHLLIAVLTGLTFRREGGATEARAE